jgi:hypothetical protein
MALFGAFLSLSLSLSFETVDETTSFYPIYAVSFKRK